MPFFLRHAGCQPLISTASKISPFKDGEAQPKSLRGRQKLRTPNEQGDSNAVFPQFLLRFLRLVLAHAASSWTLWQHSPSLGACKDRGAEP